MHMPTSAQNALHPYVLSAHRTLDIESLSLLQLKFNIGDSFIQTVDLFHRTVGHVIVMGMGKSGHIGRKIAATLSSTGTPAFFVHPAEASHGDLGMVTSSDTVLAISNSGESDELAAILPLLKRLGVPIVAMTGNADSTLATHSTHVLITHVEQEACPLNLAPTASTTAQLAMGDAIAIACLERRGFQATDFAAAHPGGALGRKLLTRVSDIMRTGASIPIVTSNMSFLEMMKLMSASGLGTAVAVDEIGMPTGIFTDGDLRRELMRGTDLIHAEPQTLMRSNPKTIYAHALAVDAAVIMENLKVTSLLAVNESGHLAGILNSNDLMRAKVI
ncbi:MAG: KpsF/GutQ family sugar-phosphate isomerase [Cytophagales bacterium]|nr:KpsF/GutQ family sugar-phosphate isomerase [Cytophagales bacterium]